MLNRIKVYLVIVCLAFCTANANEVNELGIGNFRVQDSQLYSSGQPSEHQLAQLSEQGIKFIINLRAEGETPWDERKVVEQLNMNYLHLPIASADDINIGNAQLLQQYLNATDGQATLVHCASSNRVGALVALYHGGILNKPKEEAIKVGKQWGLTSLTPVVEKRLDELQDTD